MHPTMPSYTLLRAPSTIGLTPEAETTTRGQNFPVVVRSLPEHYGPYLHTRLHEQLKCYGKLLVYLPNTASDTNQPTAFGGCSTYAASLACMLLTYMGHGFAVNSSQLLLTAWSKQSVSRPIVAQDIMSVVAALAQGIGRIQAHFTRDREDPVVTHHNDPLARRAHFSRLLYQYTGPDLIAIGLLIGATVSTMQGNQNYVMIVGLLSLAHTIQVYSQVRQYGFWYCVKLYYGNDEQQATQVAMKHTIDGIEIMMNNLCTTVSTYVGYSLALSYAAGTHSKLLNYSLMSACIGVFLSCAPKYLFWRHSQRRTTDIESQILLA